MDKRIFFFCNFLKYFFKRLLKISLDISLNLVFGGIVEALELAKQTAGEKNTWVMGGANIIQQYLVTGLIKELRLHIAPVLLKQGIRLFENIGAVLNVPTILDEFKFHCSPL